MSGLPFSGAFCFAERKEDFMETRVALIGIVVECPDAVEPLNKLLHEFKDYIVGRMGIPYHKRNVSIISIVIDAPADVISALSGKVGSRNGVTAKALSSKMPECAE